MKRTFLCLNLVLTGVFYSSLAFSEAKLLKFETARLSQVAGTGVASLLINESTILNPAAIAFFKDSTLYYQRTTEELDEKSDERAGNFKEGLSEFYSISDTTTSLKGSFSYLYLNNADGKRKKVSLSGGAPIGAKTALGLIISRVEEESEIQDGDYTQITVGAIHNVTQNLILGFTYVDPARAVGEYSHYTVGVQYRFNEYFTVMGDAGSGDVANPDKSSFNRLALQIAATERLFFRYGISYDRFTTLKTVGYGLSWVGPKFALELAIKREESVPGMNEQIYDGEELTTSSLGITAFF